MLEYSDSMKIRRPKNNSNYPNGYPRFGVAEPEITLSRILEEIRQFLTNHLGYSNDEASVYLFGLDEGTITSGSVSKGVSKLRTSSAKDILERLASQGLFQQTPRKGGPSGTEGSKGYTTYYRVIPPAQAFDRFSQEYAKFKSNIEKIGEHLEIISESEPHSSEVWLTRQHKIAAVQGAGIIRSAKRSVKIYGHDCSWLANPELKDAVAKAASRHVRVDIIATSLTRSINKAIRESGIKPKLTGFVAIPFCIVDDNHLLIPHPSGEFKREFGLLSTTNQYMVGNFVKMFASMNGQKGR